ncbi:MAG: hypothetical protein HOJ88_00320 [Proteobacteria bacterium]|nr:hypothetical protein [Pseudomonadota bacterium]
MLALSAAASPAWAQVDGTAPAGQSDQITLNLQDVDIRVLINTVAEVTGRNFVVDPRVKGKVSIISGSPLGSEQLYNVFLSILAGIMICLSPFPPSKIEAMSVIKGSQLLC